MSVGTGINTTDQHASAKLLAVDLFCGAGGLSLGLFEGGIDVVAHLDNWQPAVTTLNENFGEKREPTDVTDLTARDLIAVVGRTPDILVGGPPCQSFTSAGRRRSDDPRGTLVGIYARLAAELRAPLVVFENVEGFMTASEGRFVVELLDPLIEAGYMIVVRKVNFANFGVPQHRKRVIAVASLLGDPRLPAPTHSAWGTPGARAFDDHPQTPTIDQAFAGLPVPDRENAPQGHVTPEVSELENARIKGLRPGQTMRDLPEALQHTSYTRRAFRRVKDGTPTEKRGGAPAGLRRLCGDQPSKAITSAAVREFVHPYADRRLTLREAARLQTFPDWFEFHGTASEQATLVGNAIPPHFARCLGGSLSQHFCECHSAPLEQGSGRLIEFTATSADAMSPVLARVVANVQDRYIPQALFAPLLS
jgi:DNA (cytosine-5)-methyltransferase 1